MCGRPSSIGTRSRSRKAWGTFTVLSTLVNCSVLYVYLAYISEIHISLARVRDARRGHFVPVAKAILIWENCLWLAVNQWSTRLPARTKCSLYHNSVIYLINTQFTPTKANRPVPSKFPKQLQSLHVAKYIAHAYPFVYSPKYPHNHISIHSPEKNPTN